MREWQASLAKLFEDEPFSLGYVASICVTRLVAPEAEYRTLSRASLVMVARWLRDRPIDSIA
jgi:hypothetical protein